MKKCIALILVLVTVFTLAACGKEPCLWDEDYDTEHVISAIGKNFGNMPADEESLVYFFNPDSQIAELSFYHKETGHFIFARMKKADAWTNIMKGMSVDFSNPVPDTEVIGHPGQVVTGEEAGMPMVCGVWFDANEGIVYALAVVGEGGTLEAYAKDLFSPSKVK